MKVLAKDISGACMELSLGLSSQWTLWTIFLISAQISLSVALQATCVYSCLSAVLCVLEPFYTSHIMVYCFGFCAVCCLLQVHRVIDHNKWTTFTGL